MFATLIGVVMLPFASRTDKLSDSATKMLLLLYRISIFSSLIGTLLLFAAIAAMGFLFSKKTGNRTLICVIAAFIAVVAFFITFAAVMNSR